MKREHAAALARPGGAAPLDFTSALYLGMRHPRDALPDWDALTLGKPAALRDVPGAQWVAWQLAQLQGCEAATLLPSTLHLFWDLFGVLASRPATILVDELAYPVARWGVERAECRGVPVRTFRHGAVDELQRLAMQCAGGGRRPLILADGYCPGTARPPPLAAYGALAARSDGLLVLDDTQALGVLGERGGGSVPRHGLAGMPVVVGASLAKGFGVPLAVLAGGRTLVRHFDSVSDTRLHTSPPSAALVVAAGRALRLNALYGDTLRRRLARRIGEFRTGLAASGLACDGGAFPVQSIRLRQGANPAAAQAALRHDGVLAIAQCRDHVPRLTFLLRADHASSDIATAVALIRHHLQEAS